MLMLEFMARVSNGMEAIGQYKAIVYKYGLSVVDLGTMGEYKG